METINGHLVENLIISETEDLVNLSLSVLPITDKQEIRLTTHEIQTFLTDFKGFKNLKCIKSSVVTNTSENTLNGEWIFEKKCDKSRKKALDELTALSQELGMYPELQQQPKQKSKKIKKISETNE